MPSGFPKPFTYQGKTYPTLFAFCRERGLDYDTVRARIKRGVSEAQLIMRRIPRPRKIDLV